MKIEHIAIWTNDLVKMRNFYVRYFNMKSSPTYVNPKKKFSSCFLYFKDAATRIELMHRSDITRRSGDHANAIGLTHVAISVGNKDNVNNLTERLRSDGYNIIGEPRTTGDGYYESEVEDAEGNVLEITT